MGIRQVKAPIDHKFSVAPMLDWTDKHCRYFLRCISKHAVLYTEMVTTGAIIYGKGDYLSYNQEEHPVVLQLGGSTPKDMAYSAEKAQEYGYDEVNINVGCPSDRVKNGSFGACLMASPEVVAENIKAMQSAVDIPVTVKCRIGIDDMDEDQDLTRFIDTVASAGCKHFIIHARKAWLQGLSPKENRDIPPLNYPRVYRIKEQYPDLQVSINGGITSFAEIDQHLTQVDGVMLGREVYANPYLLAEVDSRFYDCAELPPTREEVVLKMSGYLAEQVEKGHSAWHVARHTLGLFQGQPGGKIWRRFLSQNAPKNKQNPELLLMALDALQDARKKITIS